MMYLKIWSSESIAKARNKSSTFQRRTNPKIRANTKKPLKISMKTSHKIKNSKLDLFYQQQARLTQLQYYKMLKIKCRSPRCNNIS